MYPLTVQPPAPNSAPQDVTTRKVIASEDKVKKSSTESNPMKQVLNSIKNKINPVSVKQKSNSQHNQKDPNSKTSYSEVTKKNSQDLKKAPIQKNDKTFDSHANSSNQHGKQDTSSESIKPNLLPMNDGPIQLARNPYDQDPLDNDHNKDNSSVPLPPHRYWEKEPQQVINNINNNCPGTTPDQVSNIGSGISV